jgi:hypothetical protein
MSDWRRSGYRKLQEQSIYNHNYGFFKHNYPLYEIRLTNIKTGKSFWGNDLQNKKNKKNRILEDFKQAYWDFYEAGLLTITSCVVNAEGYESVSAFIDNKKRLLKKHNIKVLGYVSVLDIGETFFKPHYHILLATTTIKEEQVVKLLNDKGKKRYSAEFLKTKTGMNNYLSKKELFSKNKKGRCYTRSRKFESLESIILKNSSVVKKSIKSKCELAIKYREKFENNRKKLVLSKTIKMSFKSKTINPSIIIDKLFKGKDYKNYLLGYFGVYNKKNSLLFIQLYNPMKIPKFDKVSLDISIKLKEHFEYKDLLDAIKLIDNTTEIVKSAKFVQF